MNRLLKLILLLAVIGIVLQCVDAGGSKRKRGSAGHGAKKSKKGPADPHKVIPQAATQAVDAIIEQGKFEYHGKFADFKQHFTEKVQAQINKRHQPTKDEKEKQVKEINTILHDPRKWFIRSEFGRAALEIEHKPEMLTEYQRKAEEHMKGEADGKQKDGKQAKGKKQKGVQGHVDLKTGPGLVKAIVFDRLKTELHGVDQAILHKEVEETFKNMYAGKKKKNEALKKFVGIINKLKLKINLEHLKHVGGSQKEMHDAANKPNANNNNKPHTSKSKKSGRTDKMLRTPPGKSPKFKERADMKSHIADELNEYHDETSWKDPGRLRSSKVAGAGSSSVQQEKEPMVLDQSVDLKAMRERKRAKAGKISVDEEEQIREEEERMREEKERMMDEDERMRGGQEEQEENDPYKTPNTIGNLDGFEQVPPPAPIRNAALRGEESEDEAMQEGSEGAAGSEDPMEEDEAGGTVADSRKSVARNLAGEFDKSLNTTGEEQEPGAESMKTEEAAADENEVDAGSANRIASSSAADTSGQRVLRSRTIQKGTKR